MTPTQAFEDAQARYVDACAPIIAQAYHDGDYDGFWQALSNATSASDFLYYKNDAFQIIEQTIILTGLLDHDISDGALHDQSFAQAVTRDTIKNDKDHPNGVHRLLGLLYAWGDFNALKTSDPSFTAARNTVALGSRIMEELANSCANDEELLHNALKLCTPTVLAEHAYLADVDNSDDNILSRIGRKNFHETTSNFMVNAASYGIVHSLCGSVAGAAVRWRQAIQYAEEQGDTGSEVAARCAHMMLASVGEKALRAETPPGYVIKYARHFAPHQTSRGKCGTRPHGGVRKTRAQSSGATRRLRLSPGTRTHTPHSRSCTVALSRQPTSQCSLKRRR